MLKLFCLYLLFITANGQRNSKRNLLRLPFRGNLDSFYNVYDPSYLAIVWPSIRNGVHVSTGGECFEELKVFFKDFSKGRAWAYIAADASGHYSGGAFSGRRHWLGSKQQCLDLDKNMNSKVDKETLEKFQKEGYLNAVLRNEFTHGQDGKIQQEDLMQRAVATTSFPPVAYTTVRLKLNITKISMAKCHEIVQGVCLPRSCSTEDIKTIIKFSIMVTDTLKTNRTTPRTIKIISTRRVENTYDFTRDVAAITLISITLLLFILCIIATLVDYNMIKCKRHAITKSFNVQKYNVGLVQEVTKDKKLLITVSTTSEFLSRRSM